MKLLQVKTLFTGLAAMLLLASTTFAEPAFANKSSFHHGHQGSQFQVYDKYFPLHNGIHFKRGHGKGFGKFSNRGKFLGHRGLVTDRVNSNVVSVSKRRSFLATIDAGLVSVTTALFATEGRFRMPFRPVLLPGSTFL